MPKHRELQLLQASLLRDAERAAGDAANPAAASRSGAARFHAPQQLKRPSRSIIRA